MYNSDNFLNKENIDMIWEIILDEGLIPDNHKKNIFKNMVITQLDIFYKREKNNIQDLFQMNKKCIDFIIPFIKNNINIETEKIIINDINTNTNEIIQPLIKIQDIHANRMNEFEKQLLQKQNEFNLF